MKKDRTPKPWAAKGHDQEGVINLLALLAAFSLLLSVSVTGSDAATIYANTPSYSDVSSAILSATSGDIVVVPPGAAVWTSALKITKGLTLQGAGVGNTVIAGDATPSFDYTSAVIINYAPTNPSLNEPFRVTGFTFDGNWKVGCISFIRASYTNSTYITNVRVDHNYFQNCGNTSFPARALLVDGLTFGVIDHNTFLNNQKTADFEISDAFGWAVPPTVGGPNYMYFEDNDITNNDSRVSAITSGGQGGRYVVSHNTINTISANADNQHYDAHGTLGGNRGTVAVEIYNNTLTTKAAAWQFLDHRGGTARIFNNKIIKPSSDILFEMREEDGAGYPALDQVKDAFYFNNTYGPTTGQENTGAPQVRSGSEFWIQLNRDYWTPASGVEADRPGTCSTDTYYGATDTGKLYKCQPANTWMLQYASYTYPHPLTQMDQQSPNAPTGLKVK